MDEKPVKEYKAIYQKLVSQDAQKQERILDEINAFMEKYPDNAPTSVKPLTEWTLREIFVQTIQTMVDIIKDISNLISMRSTLGNVTVQREIIKSVLNPNRRVFVGIWLIVLSFILYFIDSTA